MKFLRGLEHFMGIGVLTLTLSALCLAPSSQGQGMVVVSNENDGGSEQENIEEHEAKPLSEEKVAAHKKIAQFHLSEKDSMKDEELLEMPMSESKVSRTDKPVALQNPARHKAEDFILNFLVKQYPKSQAIEDKVEILENLQNFAHKFENGIELFKSTQALDTILLPALNSSTSEIRKSALGVFATASQNNREVQDLVGRAGVIRSLIHIISNDSPAIQSKALFALSSIVLNNVPNQVKLLKDGGIPPLLKIASQLATRKRSLNFITDMLTERTYCRAHKVHGVSTPDVDACDELGSLEKALRENGWCDILVDSVKNIPGLGDQDQIITAEAVNASPFCSSSLSNYVPIFQKLLKKVEHKAFDSQDFDLVMLKSIILRLKQKTEL